VKNLVEGGLVGLVGDKVHALKARNLVRGKRALPTLFVVVI
jgi:hypothetical protein